MFEKMYASLKGPRDPRTLQGPQDLTGTPGTPQAPRDLTGTPQGPRDLTGTPQGKSINRVRRF